MPGTRACPEGMRPLPGHARGYGEGPMAVGRRPVAVGGVALAALPFAFSLLLPPLLLSFLLILFVFLLVNRFVYCGPRVCVL